MNEDVIWILLIGGLIAFAIWGFVQVANQGAKKADLRERVDSLTGFSSSHFLVKVPLYSPIPIGIAIDDQSKQVCLINGDSFRLVEYGDIIESEILSGGMTVTKTSRASQFVGTAVGGLLLGGVGAIIGGLSGSKHTVQDVKDVSLKLVVNDTSNPVHIIDFIELTNTGGTVPEIALREAQSWHDLLSVIITQAKQEAETKEARQPVKVQSSSAEVLIQLSALHKTGSLTDDEFAAAKKSLLS